MDLALTVSQITNLLKTTIEQSFYGLTVEGEISGFKVQSGSGHWYFTLKDSNAVLGANMWRSCNCKLGFVPKDGDKVIVSGSINIYAPRGSYAINCLTMRKSGDGDILARLEERKKYYASLGYFDEDKKKKIPLKPSKIAVVTSATGAALQDILQITGRRAPSMDILIAPAQVQGEGAAVQIADRINQINTFGLAQVIIVGRGGGSIEDLLPFSEDCVIEAIYRSQIPVISAVGHEIDYSLSDFVADLRAPTPSAAAELVCENQLDRLEMVNEIITTMTTCMQGRLNQMRMRFASSSPQGFSYAIKSRILVSQNLVQTKLTCMQNTIEQTLLEFRNKINLIGQHIEDMSPKSILERGFSIVTNEEGKTIRDVKNVKTDSKIKIILNKGSLSASVLEVKDE